MAKSQDADDAPKHRPLPTVEMALLPHELRALRVRQATFAVLAVLIGGTAFAATLARPWLIELVTGTPSTEVADPAPAPQPVDPPADPPVAMPAAVAEARPEPPAAASDASAAAPAVVPAVALDGPLKEVKRFGHARGFRDAVVKAGALPAEADAIVAALQKLVDFRRAQPEDELILERDPSRVLAAIEYRASLTERFRAQRNPDATFTGTRVEVPIERRRIARGGYVSDSLGVALEGLGLKSSLAGLFVEAFEGKIDFKKQVREGDSFKLIVDEEYIEGQLQGYGRVHALSFTGSRTGEALAFWFDGERTGDFYDESGRGLHGGWLRTPLRYDHLSSGFNLRRRHPILRRIVPHQGVDYAAAPGTTVWAAADGVVTFVGERGANGNLVALQHAGGYETFYAHLLRITRGLTRGQRVQQRQPIGAVGSTGRSTGPHLHFALKRHGRFIDPQKQLNGPGKLLPDAVLPRFKRLAAQLKRELAAITLAPAPAKGGAALPPEEEFHEDPVDL